MSQYNIKTKQQYYFFAKKYKSNNVKLYMCHIPKLIFCVIIINAKIL